jgi:hypothetical protein
MDEQHIEIIRRAVALLRDAFTRESEDRSRIVKTSSTAAVLKTVPRLVQQFSSCWSVRRAGRP